MKAAVVREAGHPPRYEEFPDPPVRPGQTRIAVRAAAVTPIAISRASGSHYSLRQELPVVPGLDGVGTTPAGDRVGFVLPRPPYGSLAERCAIDDPRILPLPSDLDDITAAAAVNPGMSCWVPLTQRARVRPGEAVLVNGATGVAGRIAVQVAKHLGARTVIATGRDEARLHALTELGADVLIPLGTSMEEFGRAVRTHVRGSAVGVILDYLWGPSAQAILDALGGPDPPRGGEPVKFVQVGESSGGSISLAGATLRSARVEILGTGLGSVSDADLVTGIGQFLNAFVPGGFRIETRVEPLSRVAETWEGARSSPRLVYSIP